MHSEAIQNIADVSGATADKARHISGVTVQQVAGAKQITAAMSSLAQSGRETAAAASALKQSIIEFEEIGERLRKLTMR